MINNKWYVLVDAKTNTATDFMQLPEVWEGRKGIWDMTDVQLINIGSTVGKPSQSFMDVSMARNWQVNGIDRVLEVRKLRVMDWLRSMRDAVLAATDLITVPDRWSNLDSVSKNKVTVFRQALRDITSGDVFNVVWPSIPAELQYIKKVNFGQIARPSTEFMQMMESNPPALPKAQIQEEQWTRIKEERERRKSGGVSVAVGGIPRWFWTDETTRSQYVILDSMCRRNNLPPSFIIDYWKTMDGTYVPMTAALLYQVMDAGIQKERALFLSAEAHRVAMMASSQPEKYDLSGNWPPAYEDSIMVK